MADGTVVEEFYSRHREMYDYLMEKKEITFASDLNNTFARSLLLAIASFFEHEVTEMLRRVPSYHGATHPFIAAMIERKVIARQYHLYFKWDQPGANAGALFSLFGDAFKKSVDAKLKVDADTRAAMKTFLELGEMRNVLVHQNYAMVEVSKTPEELVMRFREALRFLDFLRENLFPPRPAATAVPSGASANSGATEEPSVPPDVTPGLPDRPSDAPFGEPA